MLIQPIGCHKMKPKFWIPFIFLGKHILPNQKHDTCQMQQVQDVQKVYKLDHNVFNLLVRCFVIWSRIRNGRFKCKTSIEPRKLFHLQTSKKSAFPSFILPCWYSFIFAIFSKYEDLIICSIDLATWPGYCPSNTNGIPPSENAAMPLEITDFKLAFNWPAR